MTTSKTDTQAAMTESPTPASRPVACDLTVFSAEERRRHLETGRDLRERVLGFLKIETGARIFFDSTVGVDRLQAWAEAERRCCAFLEGARAFREDDRVVLEFDAPGDGARFWSELFMGMGPESFRTDAAPSRDPLRTSGDKSVRGGLLALLVAGGACLACLMPFAGGYLVARGLLPAGWNLNEGVYLAVGAALAGWLGWRHWRKRGGESKAKSGAGCGC